LQPRNGKVAKTIALKKAKLEGAKEELARTQAALKAETRRPRWCFDKVGILQQQPSAIN